MAKKDKRIGKRPGLRKEQDATVYAEETRANQWQGTKQQEDFLQNYLEPSSDTFGNSYASAIKAGYSDSYAKVITANSLGNEWVKSAVTISHLNPNHIMKGLEDIAKNSFKDSDRIAAYKLIGQQQGMFVNKNLNVSASYEDLMKELK